MRLKPLIYGIVAVALVIGGAIGYAHYEQDLSDLNDRLRTTGPLAVHHVADGDSFTVVTHWGKNLAVRMLGVNAKELAHKGRRITEECWGPEAAKYMEKLLKGKIVTVEFDKMKTVTDDHDRILVYAYAYGGYWSYLFGIFGSGIDLNKLMIEAGYAEEWLYLGDYTRSAEFLAAETKAREANIGGWAACSDFKKHPRKPTRKRKAKGT